MVIRPRSYGPHATSADNEPRPPNHRRPLGEGMQFRHPSERTSKLVTGLVGLLYCGAVFADDVTGSDSLLCYGLSAARCETGSSGG